VHQSGQRGRLHRALPQNSNTKLLITTAAKELASAKATLAVMRAELDRLAQQLPEYETARSMYGVGETTAVQLMAGDW